MSKENKLACAGRAVQQHALGLRDAQGVKELGVLQRQLNHLRRGGGRGVGSALMWIH